MVNLTPGEETATKLYVVCDLNRLDFIFGIFAEDFSYRVVIDQNKLEMIKLEIDTAISILNEYKASNDSD